MLKTAVVLAAASPAVSIPSGINTADVPSLANSIYTILGLLVWPLALAAILYSAFIVITGGGSPDSYNKLKKNILWLLTGIFIIFFTFVFIRLAIGLVAKP